MSMMTEASSNLTSRPAEEHFPSMEAILKDAQQQKERCRTLLVDDRAVFFHEGGVDLGDQTVRLNAYTGQAAGTLSGVPAPLARRLKPRTWAQVMNETWPRDHNGDDARMWLLERTPEHGDRARAITSASYSRLWDADLLAGVDRWAIGSDWAPAYPELHVLWGDGVDNGDRSNMNGNDHPALFRSDRDSFCFFMGPREDDGGTFGGLRPGLMFWNSEVGARSFGFRRFYFRGMCSNFLIWDAREVKERRARHTKQVQRVFRMFNQELQRLATPITMEELDRIQQTAEAVILERKPREGDADFEERLGSAIYRRTGSKVTQAQARSAARAAVTVEANQAPRGVPQVAGTVTFWQAANGLTWAAKSIPYAKDRADVQEAAGLLLSAALK